jgi:hypothetical protein
MKRVAYALLCCWLYLPASSQRFAQDSAAISQLLMQQQADWNRGDISAFMEGYWKSDRLTFTGAAGITYGWQATYQRYLRTYDSPEKMGQLQFTLLEFKPLGKKYFSVIGKWQLRRTAGDIGGYFTLLLRRFRRGWLIIADHTS